MAKNENDTVVSSAEQTKETPIFAPEILKRRLPLRRGKGKRRRQHWSAKEIRSRFAACPRCSFFLAAYECLPGVVPLETAVSHVRGGWLTLSWTPAMRELIYKAYGNRSNQTFYYYEGLCPECRRTYMCWVDTEDAPGSFHITI